MSKDGRFQYHGGVVPVPEVLAERAARLARRAVAPIGGLCGYVGVDMILGDAPDGSSDVAIEINPRLTTSYVGLCALAESNLAAAMLAAVRGDTIPSAVLRPGRIRFNRLRRSEGLSFRLVGMVCWHFSPRMGGVM